MANMTQLELPVLCTITISHYAESARWALTAAKIRFEERSGLPVVHILPGVLPSKPGTSRKQVPYLLLSDGACKPDSWSILKYAVENGSSSIGAMPSEELQGLIDELGDTARTVAYDKLIDSPVVSGLSKESSFAQRTAWYWLIGLTRRVLSRLYVRSGQYVEEQQNRLSDLIVKVQNQMGITNGVTHPTDLTATNIALAAIMYPLLAPPNLFGGAQYFPPENEFSDDYKQLIENYRQTELGKFAMRMYKEKRIIEG